MAGDLVDEGPAAAVCEVARRGDVAGVHIGADELRIGAGSVVAHLVVLLAAPAGRAIPVGDVRVRCRARDTRYVRMRRVRMVVVAMAMLGRIVAVAFKTLRNCAPP